MRIITKSGFNAHTEHLFCENIILTFDDIILLQSALFMHSYIYNYAPSAFTDLWTYINNRNIDNT